MKKQIIGLWALGFLLIGVQVQAQQIFKGKITYKTTFSGDEKLVSQAKAFMPALEEIITDGKSFRVLDEGGFATKEILFEAGKEHYYLINAKDETITKEKFRKRSKSISPPTFKKIDEVKQVAGLTARKYEVWVKEKKRAEVWVNEEYVWNLENHPYRFSKTLMLDASTSDLGNKVLLGLNYPHPSGKAEIIVWATEITTNISKDAFKLPKGFKMVTEKAGTSVPKKEGGK
ncbi:MAG TPA: hypothetical protein DCS93_00995 [Microscillaceae bacterium]|nr:hypothetical protein [Microscillaceae bacterium]